MKFSFLFPFFALLFTVSRLSAHGGTVKGIVVDAETNTELAGASVSITTMNRTQTTNDLGLFSFNDLEAGAYTVHVNYIGYLPLEQTVVVTDHETVDIKFSLHFTQLELADVAITVANDKPLSTLSQVDIRNRPINSTQDVLRFVPGLFIAQHAGGGKAEQIFLRGFDLDHGTDIALFADGMPVNMVSHAHGQGYADLHFLIPELVDRVDFQKGPYYASVGNLNTAGYVKFETPEVLRQNMMVLEAGQFNTFRTMTALDLLGERAAAHGTNAYVAAEGMFTKGYFDVPQDFKRLNLFGKLRQTWDGNKVLTVSVSKFASNWRASGQIPQRAVNAGLIDRFGSIDTTEGGHTGRLNLNVEHAMTLPSGAVLKNQFYLTKYDFELYSDFTFFLNDPVNGDQIRQKENRNLYGYNGSLSRESNWLGRPLRLEAGLQIRYDEINNIELSHTLGQSITLNPVQLGDVHEINAAQYAEARWQATDRLSATAGLRYDEFIFSYFDKIHPERAFQEKNRSILDPKLSLNYKISEPLSLYAQAGTGFHSNDTRVILGAGKENILPRAIGYEVGASWKPYPALLIVAGLWRLDLEQEFVYVGDEGVVEPGGRTEREGLDFSARWQLLPTLYLDADYNFTHPRSKDEPEGANYIPLAPLQSSVGGLTFQNKGWRASLRYRYMADRPANEDYSVTADGYFILDALVACNPQIHHKKSGFEIQFSAQNLTNTAWREAQFDTESRLKNEPAPVSEIQFTPGTPFFLKSTIVLKF